jgi:formate dehydrogenase iron-sulfur subunit
MATAMLIDVSRCTACRSCQVACKAWNDLPGEVTVCLGCYDNPPDLSPDTWNRIAFYEVEREGGQVAWLFRPVRCLHCTEASCVSVCPTGAAAHQGEFVVIDPEWCIGCGYCEQACPFNTPRLGHGTEKGSARKCRFCVDRVTNGKQPACASACPTGAIEFGDRNALIAKAKDRVAVLKGMGLADAHLYGENLLGGLHQMYVLTDKPGIFGLPEAPRMATRNVLGSWLSGIVTAGIVAAVPFWLLFRRKEALAADDMAMEEAPAEEVSEGGE